MMEKFGTFYQFSNDRINITLIWVWFSNKVLTIKKNEKINLSKVILKLECLFYLNIYIYYFILFYIRRAILTQTNPKKGLIEKKPPQIL